MDALQVLTVQQDRTAIQTLLAKLKTAAVQLLICPTQHNVLQLLHRMQNHKQMEDGYSPTKANTIPFRLAIIKLRSIAFQMSMAHLTTALVLLVVTSMQPALLRVFTVVIHPNSLITKVQSNWLNHLLLSWPHLHFFIFQLENQNNIDYIERKTFIFSYFDILNQIYL